MLYPPPQSAPTIDQFTGLGAAGVMGAMWLWERRTSRRREQQIDEAQRGSCPTALLDELLDVVRQHRSHHSSPNVSPSRRTNHENVYLADASCHVTCFCVSHVACSRKDERDIAATAPRCALRRERPSASSRRSTRSRAHAQPIATAIGFRRRNVAAIATGRRRLGAYNNAAPERHATQNDGRADRPKYRRRFPAKTDQQKAALSAVQDQATQKLVSGIKVG